MNDVTFQRVRHIFACCKNEWKFKLNFDEFMEYLNSTEFDNDFSIVNASPPDMFQNLKFVETQFDAEIANEIDSCTIDE